MNNLNKNNFIPDYNKFRIFQIGFNKCGTTSLFKLFKNNGISSVHYDNGDIAKTIYNNHNRNKPLISYKYRKKIFFSDMENIFTSKLIYIGPLLFRALDKEYPNSKFILNLRNKDNWIESRYNHDNGNYVDIIKTKLNKTDAEVIEMWENEWDDYHLTVINYFKFRPNDLLIFNIEKDDPIKIYKFFKPYFNLDMTYYGHYGKT